MKMIVTPILGDYTFTGFLILKIMIRVPNELFLNSDDIDVKKNSYYFPSIEF